MACSVGRPPSKSGDAIGEGSTLKRSVPSLGLLRNQDSTLKLMVYINIHQTLH